MDRPAFLETSDEERAAWADLPMTAAFLQWVDWEIQTQQENVADLVATNHLHAATVGSGMLLALHKIKNIRAKVGALPPPEEDEPVNDPAALPQRRTDADRR